MKPNTNTHRGPWGGSPGKVIPTTVSASACGLCSQLERDAADHWRARSSGPRTREANGAYAVFLPPLRHLFKFPAPTIVTDPARQASTSFEGQPCQVLVSADSACAFARYPTVRGASQYYERGSQPQFEYRPADRRQGRPNGRNRSADRDWCRGDRDSAVRSPLGSRPPSAVFRLGVRLFCSPRSPRAHFPSQTLSPAAMRILSEKPPNSRRNWLTGGAHG